MIADGEDCVEEGAVGHNGYGFVFIDIDYIIKYIDFVGSGKVCSFGHN